MVVGGTTETLTALLGATNPTGDPSATVTLGQGLERLLRVLGGFKTPVATSSSSVGVGGFNGAVFTSNLDSRKEIRSGLAIGLALGAGVVGFWMF